MGDFAELTSGCEYATRKRHCCDFRADMHSPRVRAAPRPCMLEPGVVWLASNCHGKARRAAIERKNNSRDLLLIVSGGREKQTLNTQRARFQRQQRWKATARS